MKRAILAVVLALTGFACAGRPQLDVPADGQESLGVAGDPVAPELLNPEDLNRALQREYPPLLKERLIGGTTVVHVFIDEEGIVRNQSVSRSSGHKELDDAALEVVQVARFSPAINEGRKIALWITMEITFVARQAARTDGTGREQAG